MTAPEQAEALGRYAAVSGLGTGVGSALGGALAGAVGYRPTFVAGVVVLLGVAGVLAARTASGGSAAPGEPT